MFYEKNNNINVKIVRTAAIFGKYDNFNDEKSHVVPALIKKSLNNQKYLEVWGDPNVIRDFVYAEDLAKALIVIAQKKKIKTINFSSGIPLSIENLANMILKVQLSDKKLKFNRRVNSSAQFRVLDNQMFNSFFPKFRRTKLEVSLSDTINWYKDKIKQK